MAEAILADFIAEQGLPASFQATVDEVCAPLAERMARTGAGPDFVNVDGGEGGTGAAPLAFEDHVALPFKLGFARVYATFARAGLASDVIGVTAKNRFRRAVLYGAVVAEVEVEGPTIVATVRQTEFPPAAEGGARGVTGLRAA